ncbi:SRPBCC family protein [Streptosporangium subroseum]|uniref:SRPBCC family protein n=1 Tax=Streptosporangium subroseum TaxID=106412 RepID=UPI00308A117B|nr:SRPBCC domain-containing protein [Streptosporangium subroseum]
MVDILHRVGITSSPDDVYAALTTIDGLAGWWTQDTAGDGDAGGVIQFRFQNAPPPSGFDMKVLETQPAERVLWEVVDGPQEWIGTQIRFELTQEDDFTIVLFSHEGWKEPVKFMYHCSTKWATFLMSLKRLIETGKGEPAPHDVKISNWH